MFEYDASISVAPDARYTELRKYDLEKLDLSTRKILDVGVIAQVAMEKTGFKGSEDYSDLFDSIGIVLQYAANQMLTDVYCEGDPFEESRAQFQWDDTRMEDLHNSLGTIEQFMLIQKLKK